MHITNGKILLNCRGMNVRGYPCFVNVSKDTKDITVDAVPDYQYDSPKPGYAPEVSVRSDFHKISDFQLFHSNHWDTQIQFVDYPIPASTYTVSFWSKNIPLSASPRSDKAECKNATGGGAGFNNVYIRNNKPVIMYIDGKQYEGSTISYGEEWNHFATVCINSNRRMIFFNGTKILDFNYTMTNEVIAGTSNRDYCCSKYVDDVVVISEEALWTDNFTPPSTYLLDDEYALSTNELRKNNIVASNVDKSVIFPDIQDNILKVY